MWRESPSGGYPAERFPPRFTWLLIAAGGALGMSDRFEGGVGMLLRWVRVFPGAISARRITLCESYGGSILPPTDSHNISLSRSHLRRSGAPSKAWLF